MLYKSGQGLVVGGKVGQILKKICVILGKFRVIFLLVINNLKIN